MPEPLTFPTLVSRLRRLGRADSVALDELTRLLLPDTAPLIPGRQADFPETARTLWRDLLRDIPFDERAFDDRIQPRGSWQALIDELTAWCAAFPERPELERARYRYLFGFVGLLLLTLNALEASSTRRGGPGGDGHDCAGTCQVLVRRPEVREVIREVYRPDDGEDAVQEWRTGIDFTTLEFHRHGTTSVILCGKGRRRAGKTQRFALKLIIYPFLRIPRVATSTREYAQLYDVDAEDARHLVQVWASADSWILMDFVDGAPLDELWRRHLQERARTNRRSWLQRQLKEPERAVLLDDMRTYGEAAFDALAELDRYLDRAHCDLSPSNILVTFDKRDRPVFHLIDFGTNYLYTYAIGGVQGSDSRFVAPEVKKDEGSKAKADLYSLGKLLVMFGGGEVDDVVPDGFYSGAPALARFVEDLIDRNPDRRLVIFRPEPGQPRYADLGEAFLRELDAEAARQPPTDANWLRATWDLFQTRLTFDLFRPLGGKPGELRRIWKQRQGKPDPGGTWRLLAWSWLSTVAWAVTISVTLTWILRQTPWSWGNRAVEAMQKLLGGSEDRFPVLDALRAGDYNLKDWRANAPALIVGVTYAMVGAKYYQNLFAGVTPMVTGRHAGRLSWYAAVAGFFMRLETVAAALLVLPVVLVQPRWWPLCTAIGQTLVFLCNGAALLFAKRALADARDRGLTTVPPSDARVTGMTGFAEWTPSALFYAIVTWVIGLLIYRGALKDIYVYALSVASINFFLFYLIKCSRGAAEIRVVLVRAMLAAERLRHVPPGVPVPPAEIPAARTVEFGARRPVAAEKA